MNIPGFLRDRDIFWDSLIVVTVIVTMAANFAGLLFGISVVIPHLLYIPVVIAAYRYPRWGVPIAIGIGACYFLMAILIGHPGSSIAIEALVRVIVIVAIGWLIATLTSRLRSQESLYEGLFHHSEGGNLLVNCAGGKRTIEAASWKAADLLRRKTKELVHAHLTLFWDEKEEEDFFIRLARDRAVYATETTFLLPDNTTFVVLVSAAVLPDDRATLTFIDITSRVHAEHALKTANDKLNMLSRISADHIHGSIDQIIETVDEADAPTLSAGIKAYLDRVRTLAWKVARQLYLAESYKDLGTQPPEWIGVQQTLESARLPPSPGVSIRFWTARLEIYADLLFRDVLAHILENSLHHGKAKNIVVTYHETPKGLDLIIDDDGGGVPVEKKQQIFEYDSGGHAGIGLFICRQIVGVTDMTISETGIPGRGARFVIHVPVGGYRIEGTADDAPAMPLPKTHPRFPVRHPTGVIVRELLSAEFHVAETLWLDYHQMKGDPRTNRIFAAFLDNKAVSVARYKRHIDGFEVDGVFTPVEFRGHGYANAAVWGLIIEAAGYDTLYMHAVRDLTKFYGNYGFVLIDESELPPTIRERYAWAQGQMEGANVAPMKRVTPSNQG